MNVPAIQPRHQRTCVGCAERGAPEEMVRLVLGPDGDVVVDAANGAFGRGAHVHARVACVDKAAGGGLRRAFRGEALRVDTPGLRARIRDAYARRVVGLLVGARRAGHLALGAEAVLELGDPALVVLAGDAGSIASRVPAGRAVAFGTKAELGALFGAHETAVLAVRHPGVARALRQGVAVTHEMTTRENCEEER